MSSYIICYKLFDTKDNNKNIIRESCYSKIYLNKRFFDRNKRQKAFNIEYSIWKTTFITIYQLSCFVGQPIWRISFRSRQFRFYLTNCKSEQNSQYLWYNIDSTKRQPTFRKSQKKENFTVIVSRIIHNHVKEGWGLNVSNKCKIQNDFQIISLLSCSVFYFILETNII